MGTYDEIFGAEDMATEYTGDLFMRAGRVVRPEYSALPLQYEEMAQRFGAPDTDNKSGLCSKASVCHSITTMSGGNRGRLCLLGSSSV